jgi:drug/metabolite transporter (DMT)-like permease
MFASFLTTVFFSLSVIFAARSARLLGPAAANLGRIVVATGLLAIWAHRFGAGLRGPAFPWFFVSGVIGFGLGDMALFGALPRIGPRLAILLTQCLAAPIAAFAEWAWLGTTLRLADLACSAVILSGVVLALAPDRAVRVERRVFAVGVAFGTGSALGHALGAVISRKANEVSLLGGFEVDGGSAAYQRILGGTLVIALAFLLFRKMRPTVEEATAARWRRGWPFVIANALAGPAIGVACYQCALKSTASGIVLPIVATSPLMTLILVRVIDGERPSRRAIVGGLIAVAGAIGLQIV